MGPPVSAEITYVRSEDLLDDSVPSRIARKLGLSRRRQLSGLGLALVALPLLTLLLTAFDDQLALDGQVLLYLLLVVVVAARRRSDRGGDLGGRGGAADQLLLRRSVHTLTIADPDQAVRWWSSSPSPRWSAARSRSR